MQTRRAGMADMYKLQHCNLRCLPENYNMRYYLYHYLSWPQLSYITEDHNGRPVGYVLAKLDDEEDAKKVHGHITSLAVLRTHRKLGVASRVMKLTMAEMERLNTAHYCSLHVRRTNQAALHLYQDTLQFRCAEVDEQYYVDLEDAFHMKKFFSSEKNPGSYITEQGKLVRPKEGETLAQPPPPASTAHVAAAPTNGVKEGDSKSNNNRGRGKSNRPAR